MKKISKTSVTFLTILGTLFIVYEYILLPLQLPTLVFYVLALIFSLVVVIYSDISSSVLTFVLVITYVSFILKEAFLSAIPNSVIGIWRDIYVTYQVAKGIMTFGHLPDVGYYSGNAYHQVTQPIHPIFSVMLSEVTGVQLTTVLRHIGSIIGGLILPLALYLQYRPLEVYLNKNSAKISWMLFLFSPWIVFFLVWGHYTIYSATYVAIMNYIILLRISHKRTVQVKYSIIWVILVVALVFTHMYMETMVLAGYGVFLIFLYTAEGLDRKVTFYIRDTTRGFLMYSIAVTTYLIWTKTHIKSLDFMLEYLLTSLKTGNPSSGVSFYVGSSNFQIPIYVRLLRWAGAISWVALFAFSFVLFIRHYNKKSTKLIITYALYTSISVVGAISVLPYIFDPKYGTDLFNRAVYYFGLMGVAPWIGFGYTQINNQKTITRIMFRVALVFIVTFGIIMAPPLCFQSWNYPILNGEDIRLHLPEWAVAGAFTSKAIEEKTPVCGLRNGVSLVGYFARVNYFEIEPSASNQMSFIPPDQWDKLKNMWTKYCYLRKSITKYPETRGYIVKENIFKKVIYDLNIIYSDSDVFITYHI